MEKVDFKREFKAAYTAKAGKPVLVDVPAFSFLMVDGAGDPNGPAFMEAIQALYSVSYTLKFANKAAGHGPDYTVMPLEGLWWSDNPDVDFREDRRERWRWTAMIHQPSWVTEAIFRDAAAEAGRKKENPGVGRLRLERFAEGRAAQVLHVGPYDQEGPTIEALHAFVAGQGLSLRGHHHEIYLGDPRRTAPERLKTILRHPVG